MEQFPEKWQGLMLRTGQFRPEEEVLRMLFKQLQTDFNRAGLQLPFGETPYAAGWAQPLSELLSRAPNQTLRSLIYLVDLSESQTAEILTSPKPFLKLSEAILYRELVKVYFQLYYSSEL